MKNKNLIVHLKLLAVLLTASCVSIAGVRNTPRDGVYEGTGPGYRGPIRVALQIESGGIADIEILEHQEDPQTGGAALEELRETLLLAGTPDTISGATGSSTGFLAAVEDAWTQALVPSTP